MITLADTTQKTKATPTAIFALWADIDNWTTFDQGIEWAKLTDSFKEGGRYTIKPKGGPKVKATIETVDPNSRFIDVSHLLGARLKFDHMITQEADMTVVRLTMTVSGPLARVWALILGKNQQADLEASTKQLLAKAEQSS